MQIKGNASVCTEGREQSVDVAERRHDLLILLCHRRHETVSALAAHFGVSARTILRDVEVLSLSVPIYTKQGRHDGGVYLMDGYAPERLYLDSDELSLLSGLLLRAEAVPGFLHPDESHGLRSLIHRYTRPAVDYV